MNEALLIKSVLVSINFWEGIGPTFTGCDFLLFLVILPLPYLLFIDCLSPFFCFPYYFIRSWFVRYKTMLSDLDQ